MVATGSRQPGAWPEEARASPATELVVLQSQVSLVVAMRDLIWSESGRLSSM